MEMDEAKLNMMRETMPHTIVLIAQNNDEERVSYEFFDVTVIEKITQGRKSYEVIPAFHCLDGEATR